VGQANTYGALAGASEGRFLFAGEHTSINNIGFLEGAEETGERAARRLLRRIGRPTRRSGGVVHARRRDEARHR
jgi:monoamine oxidase